jgi:hypothetical protein
VIEHDDQVWLHQDCRRFWLKEHTLNVHGAGAWTDWPWESR